MLPKGFKTCPLCLGTGRLDMLCGGVAGCCVYPCTNCIQLGKVSVLCIHRDPDGWYRNLPVPFDPDCGVDSLLGQVVISCEEIPLPDSLVNSLDINYNPKCEDSITYYGIEIRTNKGTTRIIYRNESNGYYGGWCSCLGEVDLPSGLMSITKDGDLYKENCDVQ